MFLNKIRKVFVCMTLILCSFVYTNTVDVLYESTAEIGGFQFGIDPNVTIVGASGGAAGDNGFTVSASATLLLGFSLTGATIPAGSGILTQVEIDGDVADFCIQEGSVIISDSIGGSIPASIVNCTTLMIGEVDVPGCTDETACNYNPDATTDDGSCDDGPIENFDCDGNCLIEVDCNQECGGSAEEDVCGVCNGPGLNEDGCCGEETLDCNDVCGGTAVVDECGVCGGNGSTCTSSGTFSLSAWDATNGTIDVLLTSTDLIAGFQFNISGFDGLALEFDETVGLAADAGFTVSTSALGIVVGFSLTGSTIPVSTDALLARFSVPDGSLNTGPEACLSEVIVSDPAGLALDFDAGDCVDLPCAYDCFDVCNGSAVVDDCGVCDGGNATQDCFGVCDGTAVVDECGVCGGDNTSCLNVVAFGTVTEDATGNIAELFISVPDIGVCDDGTSVDQATCEGAGGTWTAVTVAGVQVTLTGINVSETNGGLEDLGWSVEYGPNTGNLLAFSLTGDALGAGLHLISTLSFDVTGYDACLVDPIISDPNGGALSSTIGDCVELATAVGGCTDMVSCNYDETANVAENDTCTYPSDDGSGNYTGNTTDGTSTIFDCEGTCTAVIDECDVCGGDDTSCADECGVPNGDNTTCADDCGVPNGGNADQDACGNCYGDCEDTNGFVTCGDSVNNTVTADCAGVCGGELVEDECGDCGGTGANYTCADDSIVCSLADCSTSVTIGFGAVGDPTLVPDGAAIFPVEITYSSEYDIAGFQFVLTGAVPESASGGAAETNGFDVSVSPPDSGVNMVLGVSFTGAVIPAGSGTLTTVGMTGTTFDTASSVCFDAAGTVFSDANAGEFDAVAGVDACVDITFLSIQTPNEYSLLQNYPNPFNPVTNIGFSIVEPGNISLKVYDISGREVSELINGFYTPGNYNVTWNAMDSYGSQLSSGIYIYKLNTGNGILSKRMVLMR